MEIEMSEKENDATPEEEAEARALAEALDETPRRARSGKDAEEGARHGRSDEEREARDDLAAAGSIRAAHDREPPLGELRARSIARAAIEEARRQSGMSKSGAPNVEAGRPASSSR